MHSFTQHYEITSNNLIMKGSFPSVFKVNRKHNPLIPTHEFRFWIEILFEISAFMLQRK